MYQMTVNKKSDGPKSRIYRFVENLLLCFLFNLERIRKKKKEIRRDDNKLFKNLIIRANFVEYRPENGENHKRDIQSKKDFNT